MTVDLTPLDGSKPGPEPESRGALELFFLLLPFFAAFAFLFPHLYDDVWYDEGYMLERFATGRVWDAFTDYHLPNNHILYTVALSLWKRMLGSSAGSVAALRAPLLVLFAATLILLPKARRRMGETEGASLGVMLFATSPVT
ncbi:MAG: hypothetical protein V1918_01570, partial [Planctomycetota bacterium]